MKNLFVSILAVISLSILSGCTLLGSDRSGIQINSSTQATVSIDGENKGTTPLTIEDLAPGEYEVNLQNDLGSWNKTIRIESGTLFYINYDLAATEDEQEGELIYLEKGRGVGVISTPGQAEVTFNGQKQGFTPYLIQSIPEGEHEIVLSRDGYKSRVIPIKGVKGHKIMVEAKLKSLSSNSNSDDVSTIQTPAELPTPSISTITSASPAPTTSGRPTGSPRSTVNPTPSPSGSPRTSTTPTASSNSSAQVKGQVTVLETSTGWLRVRDKAGTDGVEIAKIDTGETLEYTEQTTTGWTRVILEDGKVGFVASRFVKVNE